MVSEVLYDIKPLLTYIAQNADIVALAGTRIYGNELPQDQASTMPRYVVLVNSAGTARMSRDRMNLAHKIFDIRCYGATMAQSSMLFLLVARHLKLMERQLVDGVLLYDSTQITGRFTSREPDTEWPVSFGSFEVNLSEEG